MHKTFDPVKSGHSLQTSPTNTFGASWMQQSLLAYFVSFIQSTYSMFSQNIAAIIQIYVSYVRIYQLQWGKHKHDALNKIKLEAM